MNADRSSKQFDIVNFRNGYHKNAPTLLLEIKEIKIVKQKVFWLSSHKVFEIELGKTVGFKG